MVCIKSCPREDYHHPLDAKLINLQEKNLQQQDVMIKKIAAKADELEKYAKELEKKSIEALNKTVTLAKIFQNKFGIDLDFSNASQKLKQIPGNPLCKTCKFKKGCPFDYNPTELQNMHCEMFADAFDTKPKLLTTFTLNDTEFKIEPSKHFADINKDQSRLQ